MDAFLPLTQTLNNWLFWDFGINSIINYKLSKQSETLSLW